MRQDKRTAKVLRADPERRAAYLARKSRERKARPEYERDRKRKWRAANPVTALAIRQANHAVESAILRGELTRPRQCSQCGNAGETQGHHPSYARADWLRVMWLCVDCHAAEHNRPSEPIS
jgi:hypothetical protein